MQQALRSSAAAGTAQAKPFYTLLPHSPLPASKSSYTFETPTTSLELSFSSLSLDEKEIGKWAEGKPRTKALIESEILSRESGDEWIDKRKWTQRRLAPIELPVKQVPSIVISQEWNYLIDPEMPKLAARWSPPEPFQIDPRLLNPALR